MEINQFCFINSICKFVAIMNIDHNKINTGQSPYGHGSPDEQIIFFLLLVQTCTEVLVHSVGLWRCIVGGVGNNKFEC